MLGLVTGQQPHTANLTEEPMYITQKGLSLPAGMFAASTPVPLEHLQLKIVGKAFPQIIPNPNYK